ncbi:MAG: hypothetical protein ACYCO0_01115 [Candidatus Micrarchaeaceae archaeon]
MIASRSKLSDADILALRLLKREPGLNHELSSERRGRDIDERGASPLVGIPGETKVISVTTTTVDGIGRVEYGTIAFPVTSNSFKAEKRSLSGENPGFLTTND